MTIVCGTDFSENAGRAAKAAASIARRRKIPLALVHAVDVYEAEVALPSGLEPSRSKLFAQAAQLTADFGIEVEPVLRMGVEFEVLVTVAKERRAQMIVVAFLGGREQSRWSLGSVAERLVQAAEVPVLIVRESASLETWTLEDRALRVMVGAEIGATSKAALRAAQGLRDIAPCDLLVTQVAWPAAEHARLGIGQPMPLDRLRPELHEILLRDLRAWAGDVSGPGETTFTISPGWGRVDHHLVSLAHTADVDLLVVGTHQRAGTARLWQGSVSRGVLEQATTNVLCVPRASAAEEPEPIASFRRVLVPTDFSSHANRAIAVAYGLVAPMGVVHLVHVVTRKGEGPTDEALAAQLRALIPERAASRGVVTEIEVVHDKEACLGIWHLAGRHAVDAICMATHGRSGVSQLFSGSQAQEVLRRASQPVMLVPPEPD